MAGWQCGEVDCPGGRELSTEELVEIVGAAAIAEGIAEVLFPPFIVGPSGERW